MSDLLDVPGLRNHITTALNDEALQDIIDYNDATILARVGPIEQHSTVFYPQLGTRSGLGGILMVPPPLVSQTSSILQLGTLAEIASVTEWDGIAGYETVLDETDYWNDRGSLRRRDDGNHPYVYWNLPVRIVWSSPDDTAIRKMVMIQLCELDVNHHPGLASFTTGQHSESYASGIKEPGYVEKREALLGQLVAPEIPPVFA